MAEEIMKNEDIKVEEDILNENVGSETTELTSGQSAVLGGLAVVAVIAIVKGGKKLYKLIKEKKGNKESNSKDESEAIDVDFKDAEEDEK